MAHPGHGRLRIMAAASLAAAAGGLAHAQCASQWYPLGTQYTPTFSVYVYAVVVLANGDVVVAGDFDEMGGFDDVHNIAIYRPSTDSWSHFAGGVETTGGGSAIDSLAVLANGDVVVGGTFDTAMDEPNGNTQAFNIALAHFNGTEWEWSSMGDIDPFYDPPAVVASLAVLPNGDVVASGGLREAGGVAVKSIARAHYNTTLSQWEWYAMPPGIANGLAYVAARPNGHAVCGYANYNGFDPGANYIAGYDFEAASPDPSWYALGTAPDEGTNSSVMSLAFESTNELLVGGVFTKVAGESVDANYIARWSYTDDREGTWTPLGSGTNSAVLAIRPVSGGRIVAGGDFTEAGGGTVNYVARWNGSSWSALQSGVNATVRAVAEMANGDIVVGGTFTLASGVTAYSVARYHENPACYANCDGSTASPRLSANDFQCFLNKYAVNDPYANCDCSTNSPYLSANDFQCFLNAYAVGCS